MIILERKKILDNDLGEIINFSKKIIIQVKFLYYFFERLFASFYLKKRLVKKLKNDLVFNSTDKFLLNEGGMFKKYVYGICNSLRPLKNSYILVPGVGYGRNLLQLASFGPKKILAFDIYNYDDEWQYVAKLAKENFGIDIEFLSGDFNVVPEEFLGVFDFIISDAVLEHVENFEKFADFSYKFLKPSGIFYASYGPIWYGPGGDHIDWGKGRKYDHLLLSEAEYQKQFQERFENKQFCEIDSCEGKWMVEKNLFSYLKAEDYLKIFKAVGFRKNLLFAKISTETFSLLKSDKNLWRKLNQINAPFFDRFCSGCYLWMRK
jgi:SAM-dependent methyltransferase